MRLSGPLLCFGALLLAGPAFACVQDVDPCTGRPIVAGPVRPAEPEPDPAPAPGEARGDRGGTVQTRPETPADRRADPAPTADSSPIAHPAPRPAAAPTPNLDADPREAERVRAALRLGVGRVAGGVRTGPAGSLVVPTAIGVSAGEAFVGVGYQGRTRYTRADDAGGVVGVGFGAARTLALEVAASTYSTFRSTPFSTGGLSAKLHRDAGRSASVAVGIENVVTWGDADAQRSVYGAASRIFRIADDPRAPFSSAVLTLGVGNGRFRSEADDRAGRDGVNLFAAAGVRVAEPVSLVADWTGQDLAAGVSVTPVRRIPLVITAGGADLTGSAGDGARFILSLGYGVAVPWRLSLP